MRTVAFIKTCEPCDTDYTDANLQTLQAFKAKGTTICPNLRDCGEKHILCYRTVAKELALYILLNRAPFETAVAEERADLLADSLDGKFWVFRNGVWQVVPNKAEAMDDIVAFALVMIDRKEGERRPFTRDGKRSPELGPADAWHNAQLDLKDMYAEVGC